MDSEPHVPQSTDGVASPLSGMLSAMLSNPELMKTLQGVMQSASPPSQNRTDLETAGSGAAGIPSVPADGLATVLSNPEMMAKLPQIMSMLRPMMGEFSEDKKPVAPALERREKTSEECRNELLCALKPFLSPERRNAVDAMLRISQLGAVIRHMK